MNEQREHDSEVVDWQVWEDWNPEPKAPEGLTPLGPWFPFAAVTGTVYERQVPIVVYRRPLGKAT